MTIVIKNRQLFESVQALSVVGSLLLPMASVRPFAKVLRKIQSELSVGDEAKKNAQKAGEVLERKADEKDEAFNKRKLDKAEEEWNKYLDEEIQLPIDKFNIDLLGDNKLGASCLMQLDWLIDF